VAGEAFSEIAGRGSAAPDPAGAPDEPADAGDPAAVPDAAGAVPGAPVGAEVEEGGGVNGTDDATER
jgi:hypothetical protein